jgi:hypothetical protein
MPRRDQGTYVSLHSIARRNQVAPLRFNLSFRRSYLAQFHNGSIWLWMCTAVNSYAAGALFPLSDHSTRTIPIGVLNIDLYGQIPPF